MNILLPHTAPGDGWLCSGVERKGPGLWGGWQGWKNGSGLSRKGTECTQEFKDFWGDRWLPVNGYLGGEVISASGFHSLYPLPGPSVTSPFPAANALLSGA